MTPWVLRWDGHEWRFADLTTDHVTLLALVHGNDSFDNLDPRKGTGRLTGLLVVLTTLARRGAGEEVAVEDVILEFGRTPFWKLIQALGS